MHPFVLEEQLPKHMQERHDINSKDPSVVGTVKAKWKLSLKRIVQGTRWCVL